MTARVNDLERALNPASVAVIGASDDPEKIGGRPISFMLEHGFTGRIIPVNARRRLVQGIPAVAEIRAASEVPEVAIIAVAGEGAVSAVIDCAELGVAVVVIMASGLGESGDARGKHQLERMELAARKHGMRMIGPNSQGVSNFSNGAILSFSTLFREEPPQDGPVAIVSQSGAMCSVPYALLRQRGIGVRYAHATGNDADVSLGELATISVSDPDVRLLILYIENLADPGSIAAAAAAAKKRSVPVLALVGGRSAEGQRAASSHTGALASEERVVSAYLEKLGIWYAKSMAEIVDMAPLYLQNWAPTGRNLGVISSSGAICVLGADGAEENGLPLASFEDRTKLALDEALPDFAATSNPVDMTAALLTDGTLVGKCLRTVAADSNVEALFLGIPVAGRGYDVERFTRDAGALARESNIPFVASFPQASIRDAFAREGVVSFDDEARALKALSRYLSHMDLVAGSEPDSWTPPPAESPEVTLNEVESLRIMADAGITPVHHALARSIGEARWAFVELNTERAVLKGVSGEVVHKSDLGLVELNVTSAESLESAYNRIEERAAEHGVSLDGILIAEQVGALHEMVVGGHWDPRFGPVVMVGAGGRYIEALPDVQILLAPLADGAAPRAIDRLRMRPVLDGVRGEAAADLSGLTKVIENVATLISDPHSGVRSLDINPVMLGERGCLAADAVVIRRGGASDAR